MLKKILIPISITLTLTACGGGSDDAGNRLTCSKGIPSGLDKLGSGMLDEPLYSLDANEVEGPDPNNPIDIALSYEYRLINHIYYEKISAINQPADFDPYFRIG